MAEIVLINGPSSVGKSTVSSILQDLLPDPYFRVSIDSFVPMMPSIYLKMDGEERSDNGFVWKKIIRDNNCLWKIYTGPIASKFLDSMHDFISSLLMKNFNVIIDDIILDEQRRKRYAQTLANHNVFLVGLTCEERELERREQTRGNRILGSAKEHIESCHEYLLYDIKIDTTNKTPKSIAQIIKRDKFNNDKKHIKLLSKKSLQKKNTKFLATK